MEKQEVATEIRKNIDEMAAQNKSDEIEDDTRDSEEDNN